MTSHLPFYVAAWIFLVGLYGVVTSRNYIHLCVSLAVTQTSTYVLLLAIGFRRGAKAPVLIDLPSTATVVDPIVQALMLTDVVVEATVIALLLALAMQIHAKTGTLDPDCVRELRS